MQQKSFSIGWASADISTDGPVNIPGQFSMRISRGVLDPVTATAMWMSDGIDDVCFVSVDLVTLRGSLTDFVCEEIKKRNPNIPVSKIILNATHTHAGPGFHKNNLMAGDFRPEMLSQTKFKQKKDDSEIGRLVNDDPKIPTSIEIMDGMEYLKFLVNRLADIICEAYEKRYAGSIAYGYGFAVVGHSRRCLYKDDVSKRPGAINNSMAGVNGHGRMYGPTNDDKFSGYEGGADSFVNLLFTFDENKKLTGTIVNVPCPSQNSESLHYLSASFWHDTRKAIRKKFGDIFILPQAAAGGDLSPRQLHYNKAESRRFALKYGRKIEKYQEEFRRKDIAERIAECVKEVYSWAKKDLIETAPIHHEVIDLELSRRIISKDEYEISCERLKALADKSFIPETEGCDKRAVLAENSRLVSERNRNKGIIRRWQEQQHNKKFKTQAHILSIGDIAFATNQFELYVDYQHRIQGRSPFTQTFIVQLSGVTGDGGGSYLATKRGCSNRGYSASRFCNLVSWKGGDELVEKTVKVLKKLWKKEHREE